MVLVRHTVCADLLQSLSKPLLSCGPKVLRVLRVQRLLLVQHHQRKQTMKRRRLDALLQEESVLLSGSCSRNALVRGLVVVLRRLLALGW